MATSKYVSAVEYHKITGIGVEEVKRLCRTGQLKHYRTAGGYYKIALDNDNSVPREEYERVLERAIKAETKLANIQAVLV